MDNDRKRQGTEVLCRICKKWIVIFLAAMLGLTILSRFLDSVIVPQVNLETPKKAVLQYQTKGTGTLTAEEILTVSVLPEISVRSVIAGPGQTVSGDTPLFAYQMDELQALYARQERKLEDLRLSLQSEQLSAQPLPKMTEEELARQSLAQAERLLARTREKAGKAEAQYQQEAAELEQEFADDRKKNREDLTKERKKAYEDAEQACELARLNKRLELKTAAWEYDNAVSKLERLEEEGASEAELREAEAEVDRADQNKDILDQKWTFEVDKAQKDMDDAYDNWQNLLNGTEDIETALKKEHEKNLKAEYETLEAVLDQLTESSDSYQDALTALENARKNDAYAQAGVEREQELSKLKQRTMEMDIEDQEQEAERIKKLLEQDGIVYAPYTGVLTKIDVSGDSGLVQIGSGGILMKAEVDAAQAKNLTLESAISLRKDGQVLDTTAELKSLEPDRENNCVRITAALSDTTLLPGTEVEFVCESRSLAYDRTIPIDALRQDNQGTYVLLAEERNTILGTELKAVRLNVTVIAKTTEKAAVEGGLGIQDRVIVESSKAIEDGSRIRVVSE